MPDTQPDPVERLIKERAAPAIHAREKFFEQIAAIDSRLVATGRHLQLTIMPMTRAFLEADQQAVDAMIADDSELNRELQELELDIIRLIALQAPVANDLRRVVSTLKAINDVTRSWALLRHVGESLRWIHPPALSEKQQDAIAQLAAASQVCFQGGIDSWENNDGEAAAKLDLDDDKVDLLHKMLLSELYTGSQSVEESVSLGLIGRYYERIADHGVEMARLIAYTITGKQHVAIRAAE